MSVTEPININVGSVLSARLGRGVRWIPHFAVRWLENLIHQDDMNELLREAFPRRSADFCRFVLDKLDIELDVQGDRLLPSDGRCVFVCNHPLGGLDGIALIDWFTRHYGKPVHFVVNDLLDAVEPLRGCFVPINKHGSQSREAVNILDEAFRSDDPLLMFPAGLVSRRGKDGRIADLTWHKMFVHKAKEHCRDIVPLYFEGHNTPTFYRFAQLRKNLGISFNIEMILLPREVFLAKGSRYVLHCGKAIPYTSLPDGAGAKATAADIRQIVYSLPGR